MSNNKKKNKHKSGKENGGQPAPLSGSHKVKNRNHSRQKNHSHHDM